MELRQFLTTTLVEIQQGVHDAIKQCGEQGIAGIINPVWGSANNVNATNIREVSFDIAVTATDKTDDKVGGGIRVWGIGVGGEIAEVAERSHVSRIQFTVPLIAPVTELKQPGY